MSYKVGNEQQEWIEEMDNNDRPVLTHNAWSATVFQTREEAEAAIRRRHATCTCHRCLGLRVLETQQLGGEVLL